MSDQPPPPPPPTPAGFWHHQPTQQSYSTTASKYTSQTYPQHPPSQVSTVPPPLYGYNPNSYHSYSQTQHQEKHGQTHESSKRRRIMHDETPYKCKACQVSLESETALRAHTEAHITCTRCSFSASRKVVNAHFSSVHGKFSGGGFKAVTIAVPGCRVQRFNICVGNHPEDVKKWIQERRKRFPRQQKKETAAAEKRETNDNETKTESALGSLLDGYGSSSSEDDNDEKLGTQQVRSTETKSIDAEEKTESSKVTVEPVSRPPNYRTRPCKYFMRNGTCRNGDACNFKHEVQSNHQQRDARANQGRNRKRQSSSSATLLRKLLENDARREAALSLQLLGYLVDCNYLQKQRSEGKNDE